MLFYALTVLVLVCTECHDSADVVDNVQSRQLNFPAYSPM